MSSDAGGGPEVKGMTGQSMAAATGKERRPTVDKRNGLEAEQ